MRLPPTFLLAAALTLACAGPDTQSDDVTVVEVETLADAEPPAAAPETKAEQTWTTMWIVILATETSEDGAKKVADQHEKQGLPTGSVYSTDELKGLKPGLFVVAPLVVDNKDDATLITKNYAKIHTGAYLKRIEVPNGCATVAECRALPSVWPFDVCQGKTLMEVCVLADGRWRTLIAFNLTGENGSEDWSYSSSNAMLWPGPAVSPLYIDKNPVVAIKYLGKEVTTLNIADVTDEKLGYIFAEEDKAPEFFPHSQGDAVIYGAREYFGLFIPTSGDF